MYSIFRYVTGYFSAEWIHTVTLKILQFMPTFFFKRPKESPIKVMGLEFKHAIGLAAGFDKDGRYLKALAKLGFASIELGTVTPKPQPGNPKPRLFRVPELQALINRMGFNNAGVDALVDNIKDVAFDGVLGISIGPNKETPAEKVWLDYEYCLKQVYSYADYIAVNISSPNTPGLRALHHKAAFSELIQALSHARSALIDTHGRYVPIVVKVSPDESDEAIKGMTSGLVAAGLDGMILTNTTVSRAGFRGTRFAKELGGVSGKPLAKRAMQCLKLAKEEAGDNLVLIASGGIDSPKEAAARIKAGASLVQLYSGLVYEGPGLIARIAKALAH
ncbi:MAG: dihydroorotate dehydrogenase (quinone) [Gammaproteobacteria bacterium]|nr:dihydroorotate dehydrogenase (quinone) [Gammaproteobacteria bacterium]